MVSSSSAATLPTATPTTSFTGFVVVKVDQKQLNSHPAHTARKRDRFFNPDLWLNPRFCLPACIPENAVCWGLIVWWPPKPTAPGRSPPPNPQPPTRKARLPTDPKRQQWLKKYAGDPRRAFCGRMPSWLYTHPHLQCKGCPNECLQFHWSIVGGKASFASCWGCWNLQRPCEVTGTTLPFLGYISSGPAPIHRRQRKTTNTTLGSSDPVVSSQIETIDEEPIDESSELPLDLPAISTSDPTPISAADPVQSTSSTLDPIQPTSSTRAHRISLVVDPRQSNLGDLPGLGNALVISGGILYMNSKKTATAIDTDGKIHLELVVDGSCERVTDDFLGAKQSGFAAQLTPPTRDEDGSVEQFMNWSRKRQRTKFINPGYWSTEEVMSLLAEQRILGDLKPTIPPVRRPANPTTTFSTD